jgi:hypothetical protein
VHTAFSDLDAVLDELVASVRGILGDTFVGAYLQGSFALGAGDRESDCDFIVACTVAPSGPVEAELRRLHDEIPTRPGYWHRNLEGSYADVGSLWSMAGLGVPWLFNDHGHRELIWDTHCNSLHTRWILRHHGITLAGPPVAELVDDVPPAAIRAAMRDALPRTLADIQGWAPMDIAWTQRYLVSTVCRVLYSMRTGAVTSKRGALEWAMDHLDPSWRPLLTQVRDDRALGWDPETPPRPGSLEAALAFAAAHGASAA